MVPREWGSEDLVWSLWHGSMRVLYGPLGQGAVRLLAELRVLGWVLCCEAAAPKFLWWGGGQGCDLQIHVGERLT